MHEAQLTTPPSHRRRDASAATFTPIASFMARALTAVVGGYGATYLLVWAVSVWSPYSRVSTVFATGGLALLPYAALALWAFAARSLAAAAAAPLAVAALSWLAVLMHGHST